MKGGGMAEEITIYFLLAQKVWMNFMSTVENVSAFS